MIKQEKKCVLLSVYDFGADPLACNVTVVFY